MGRAEGDSGAQAFLFLSGRRSPIETHPLVTPV